MSASSQMLLNVAGSSHRCQGPMYRVNGVKRAVRRVRPNMYPTWGRTLHKKHPNKGQKIDPKADTKHNACKAEKARQPKEGATGVSYGVNVGGPPGDTMSSFSRVL